MLTRILLLACFFSVPQLAMGADDLIALEGTWLLVSTETDGKAAKVGPDDKLMIAGDQMTLRSAGVVKFAAVVKFDASKKPKTMDMNYTEGPNKGKRFQGIYALDGDMLKLCRADKPGDQRPTEFTSKQGGINSVYKRVR